MSVFVKAQSCEFINKSISNIEYQEDSPLHTFDTSIEEMCIAWRYKLKTAKTCNPQSVAIEKKQTPDSVRLQRINEIPTIIPMVYNPYVEKYINLYQNRHRQMSYMLALSKYYFPIFENILEQYQLPTELKYLTIVESALNPRATSRMGAAGLWQFMPATGKLYGLENNSLIDERRDPIKSTYAAAQHLKDLYHIFQDWNLVIAAYNCGTGNVNRAIRRAGGKKDYWQIYEFLPSETRNYVPAFIAINYLMYYAPDYAICPSDIDFPIVTDTIHINKRLYLQQVADQLSVPIEYIRMLNPSYKNDIIPSSTNKTHILRLPDNLSYLFIEKQDSIYTYQVFNDFNSKQTNNDVDNVIKQNHHKVKSGESLSLIAKKYGVTIIDLKKWNKLQSDRLQIGQMLRISQNSNKQYTVKSGDTLWSIASVKGVSIDNLRKANSLHNLKTLKPGMILIIP